MVPRLVSGRHRAGLLGKAALAALFCAVAAAAQQTPARIVSTFPSATETLFALGAGGRVVGVSNYCSYPPAALALPKVGSYMKPDPETIARLRPDLVVIDPAATELAGRLSALGIRSAAVKVGSLADIYATIRKLGAAVGLPGEAQRLNAGIQSRLEAIRAGTRGQKRLSVLMIVGRDPGALTDITGVGPGSYLDELLKIAGGANALEGSPIAYPHISLETVVRLNPDVILDISMTSDPGSDPNTEAARLRRPWLAHGELRAVRNGRVFGLTSEALVTPGPRVVDAVGLIQASLRQAEQRP